MEGGGFRVFGPNRVDAQNAQNGDFVSRGRGKRAPKQASKTKNPTASRRLCGQCHQRAERFHIYGGRKAESLLRMWEMCEEKLPESSSHKSPMHLFPTIGNSRRKDMNFSPSGS